MIIRFEKAYQEFGKFSGGWDSKIACKRILTPPPVFILAEVLKQSITIHRFA
ncbi:MAG: hypothetical protein PHY93_06190 [Bacteriovorax sp.]|nr:hypothetical protein [Bacteriovorax sp.]